VIVRFDQSLPTVDSNSITLAKSQEPPNNDLMSDDELSKFLTRAAEKFRTQEDKKVRSTIKPTKTFENTNIEKVKEAPGVKVTRAGMGIEPIVQHIKKATQQSSNSDNEEGASKFTQDQPVSKGKQKFSLNDSRPAGKPIELIPSSLKMFSMLSVVLGIMFLLFFVFKKYVLKNTLFGGGEKLINVLGSGFLGPKKNIVLVEVAGEILVLGMSQNNISLLTNITDPEKIEEIKSKGGKGASGLNWNGRGTQPKEGKRVANKVTGQFANYMKKVSEPETKSKDKSVSDVTAQIKQQMGRFKTARA
jgi:flagellar protein FliO/FliZ